MRVRLSSGGLAETTAPPRTAVATSTRRAQGVERRLSDVAATLQRDPDAASERARTLIAALAAMLDRLDRGRR